MEANGQSKNNIITLIGLTLLVVIIIICGTLYLTKPDDKQFNIISVPVSDTA